MESTVGREDTAGGRGKVARGLTWKDHQRNGKKKKGHSLFRKPEGSIKRVWVGNIAWRKGKKGREKLVRTAATEKKESVYIKEMAIL